MAGIWLAALACVAAFGAPASAVASADQVFAGAFKVQGTHGYSILALPSADEDDGILQLIVARKGSGVS